MEAKPRIARLTAIVIQLQSKKIVTATFLAEKFNVSVRTIYRDIRTLEASGVPIYTEEGKGYSLLENFYLPPVMFSEEEANALITAANFIDKNKDESLVQHYTNALTKIKSVLKSTQKEKVELLSERIVFRNNIEEETSSKNLIKIQSAITSFNLIEITYLSLENKFTKRVVEPFALYSTNENWLLIAVCRLRDDFRVFRLDHIQQLIILEEKFEKHTITLQEYFEICRSKFSNS
ncbi:helix-turn-helix transcriptional regulator [Tenacibaculum sp. M341]|uniref:helix-turn-helix transcriptional regulator n=1 Tax=Tenacibaculum sp. M341 TaxID=2530339 RepID=UPI0010435547|nr:YafY family protein [Tenacibaculum sp. M341]TCI89959.1 YafY family transcriptional regulator [Tenacibaculum sp. M341]